MEKQGYSGKDWLRRLGRLSFKQRRRRSESTKTKRQCSKSPNMQAGEALASASSESKTDKKQEKFIIENFRKMQKCMKNCLLMQNESLMNGISPRSPSSSNSVESSIENKSSIKDPLDTSSHHLCVQPNEERRAYNEVMFHLINSNWYWGPLSREEAEERLDGTCDGTFLVRDSASTNYVFSISFRTLGKTLHARIDYRQGSYSLYDQIGFQSVYELIQSAMELSKKGIYCYSSGHCEAPYYPIRFLHPLSRYTNVPSLKHLCRFVIRQCTNINDLTSLPLPSILKSYLQEERYIYS